jgi:crotonobetainyl-CoA:carnitine CoA-transferase CaiB-like acyl-CoA transferase
VPCAPVLTRDQIIAHPHVLGGDILLESDHPAAGRLRQTRTAARFETPTVIRHGAPGLGEHNAEILRELGLTEAEVGELGREGVVGIPPAASGIQTGPAE